MYEDARKMHRAKILCQFLFGENGEGVTMDVMIWLEEWTDRDKF